MSLDKQFGVSYSLFLLYVRAKNDYCFYFFLSFFRKQKEVWNLYHCFIFWRKIFHILYSINWLNFIVWFPLLFEIFANVFIVIICIPVCHIINFEFYLSFLIMPFPYITKNRILRWNKKHYSSFLNGFLESQRICCVLHKQTYYCFIFLQYTACQVECIVCIPYNIFHW